jgi:tetratricopeptide (TPR) repeat protein
MKALLIAGVAVSREPSPTGGPASRTGSWTRRAVFALALFLLPNGLAAQANGQLQIHFIKVGQGDAAREPRISGRVAARNSALELVALPQSIVFFDSTGTHSREAVMTPRWVSGLLAILLATSRLAHAQAQPQKIEMPQPGGRIQLDRWTDVELGVSEPLYQIVRLTREGGESSGTGFLLPNCRIMTAAHVVAAGANRGALERSGLAEWTFDNGDLVGERYEYHTQPLPWLDGRRATGEFVVLAHGATAHHSVKIGGLTREDWALGYDEQCLAEKLHLGHVDIRWTTDIKDTPAQSFAGRRLFTAGYSGIEAPGLRYDTWPMYIDSKCQAISIDGSASDRENFNQYRALVTDCSGFPGGSGQPLLAPVMANGVVVRDSDGRPKLEALGIASFLGDKRTAKKHLTFVAFAGEGLANLRDLLTVPVTGSFRDTLQETVRERDIDRRVSINIRGRIKSGRWARVTSPNLATALRDCTMPGGLAGSCTALLQMPDATQTAVLEALARRANVKFLTRASGPGLRDVNLAFEVAASMDASQVNRRVLERLYTLRADAFDAMGEHHMAADAYGEAVDLLIARVPSLSAEERSRTAEMIAKRLKVNEAEHYFEFAIKDYDHLLTLNPSDAKALNGRCYARASFAGSSDAGPDTLQQALVDCNRALQLEPGNAAILDSRAFTYMKMERFGDAVREFDAALARNPKSAASLFGRGLTKFLIGDETGFQTDIAAAKMLQPKIWDDMLLRMSFPMIMGLPQRIREALR